MARICKWNDVEYESITAAAKAHKISRQAMWMRLRDGYTKDSDMRYYNQIADGTYVEIEGHVFRSIALAARTLNIPYRSLYSRYRDKIRNSKKTIVLD